VGSTGAPLHERLEEASSSGECLRLLVNSLPLPMTADTAFSKALRSLTAGDSDLRLEEVARAANLSPRQFRRRCLEGIGLTPKHLCRVLRFQRVLRLLRHTPARGSAHLAAESGYYDQAHLIRDFREFASATPSGFAAADGRFFQSAGPIDPVASEA
jgi:transcriptional regulator GlxA family with amidase domain